MGLNRTSGTAREPGLGAETAGSGGRHRRAGGGKLAGSPAKVAAASALLVIPALAAVSAFAPAASAAVAHPAAKQPSKVTVSAAPGTAVAGTKVTLSATVKSAGATPTGTVSFYSGSVKLCAAALARAAGHCTAVFRTAGTYTVTGKYSGNSAHAAASGTTRVKATLAATGTAVSVSTSSPYPGEAVTLTAAVSSHSPLAPTGTVKFSDAAGTLCTGTLSGGKAHCTHAWKATGHYTVTARYAGDGAHAASSRTSGAITVAKLATATDITSISPGSVAPGTPSTVTVTVTTPAGTPAPTGTVTIAPTDVAPPVAAGYICTVKLTATSDGTGSCEVTPPNPSYGIIDYEATYGGDSAHGSSVSTGTHELLVPDTTTTTVAFSPAAGTVHMTDVITATVVNEAGDNISPSAGGTGTVTFSIGGTDISGCIDVSLSYSDATGNTATCDYTPGASGSVTVTAAYSGDDLNDPSSGTGSLSVTS